jgi:prevent-host-death family protein
MRELSYILGIYRTFACQPAQQIVPISELRMKQVTVLKLMDKAPVILSQRSKPRAVLVSVEQWDAIAYELRNFSLYITQGHSTCKPDIDNKSEPTQTHLLERHPLSAC